MSLLLLKPVRTRLAGILQEKNIIYRNLSQHSIPGGKFGMLKLHYISPKWRCDGKKQQLGKGKDLLKMGAWLFRINFFSIPVYKYGERPLTHD